jgi:transposase
MDTTTQPLISKRQFRPLQEKLRMVQEALAEGASVARIARANGVNANLLFNWCRLYRAGRLGRHQAKLLPVRVTSDTSETLLTSLREPRLLGSSGRIHIQLPHAQVRVEGSVDPVLVRVLLECLGQ